MFLQEMRVQEPWKQFANCREVDPDLFFPERRASTKEAKRVCHDCVVREQRLQYALDNGEKFGIWGGMNEQERRRVRRERARARHRAALAERTKPRQPSSEQPQPTESRQPSLTESTRIEPPDVDPGAPTVASPAATVNVDGPLSQLNEAAAHTPLTGDPTSRRTSGRLLLLQPLRLPRRSALRRR